jgi:replicative DNA helicase
MNISPNYKLLFILLNSLEKVEILSSDIRSINFFEDIHEIELYRAILWSFNKNKLLTEEKLEYFLKEIQSSSFMFVSECTSLFREINSIRSVQIDDYEVISNEVEKSYLIRAFRDKLKILKDKGESNFKTNLSEFAKSIDRLSNSSDKESNFEFFDSAESFIKIVDKLEKESKEPEKRIICGIKEVDECMVVGFRPGTLTLTVADVGGGKTTMMLNIAFNLYKRNHNVLFIPLEMPFEEIFKKFISRECLVEFEKLARPQSLSDQDWANIKKHEPALKAMEKKFMWADVKSRPTVSEIKKAIEKQLPYFKPEIVVIDYIANIKPETNSDNWLAVGDILKDLRAFGKLHKFAILSAAQLSRDGIKKMKNDKDSSKSPGSEDLRGSHEYSADADNIFAQVPSQEDPNRKLLLYCIKARYGKKTFGDKNYAILDFYPEYSKIESSNNYSFDVNSDDLKSQLDMMFSPKAVNNEVESKTEDFDWFSL